MFRRKMNSRKARFESLEDRRMLTVTVKTANNDIFISGDGANSGIAVFQDAIRRLFIYGDTATAIAGDGTVAGAIADTNAGGGREFDPGQFTNIFINMGSGNDLVQVAGLQSTDVGILSINTGDASGGDNVSIGQSTFAGSPDIFFGFNAVTKGVSVSGGNGNDVLSINALTAPSLSVNGGSLPDVINIATSDNVVINGNASVDLNDGGGTVNVGQNGHTLVVDGSMNVAGSSGNNFFTLDGLTVGNVLGDLNVQTGAGNDQVTVGSNSAVAVSHGSLNINVGDSTTGNVVTIGANATVTVSGSTAINSGSGNTLANTVNVDNLTTAALSINTGNADDTINIAQVHGDAIHGNLTIATGDGTNTVNVGSNSFPLVVDGLLSIVTGSGSDTINLQSLSAAAVVVNSGAGSDQVTLNHVTSGGYIAATLGEGANTLTLSNSSGTTGWISSGSGLDTININAAALASVAVVAGDGDNVIHLDNSTISQIAAINTGIGADQISMSGTHADSVAINTGDGNDTLDISSASAIDHLMAQLGTGNDTFTAENSTFSALSFVDGGIGKDHSKLTKVKHAKNFSRSI